MAGRIRCPSITDKVTGKTQWSCDVTLPGMLHARMVLASDAWVDIALRWRRGQKTVSLTAEVVKKGNLVAVVSPNEWEAINAARAVATGTKWTDWAGLPGGRRISQERFASITGARRPKAKGKADEVKAALASAGKTISATL